MVLLASWHDPCRRPPCRIIPSPGSPGPANLWFVMREGPRDPGWIAEEFSQYEGDYHLMWSAESAYNYILGRPSPTRYVHQYPLYTCGYATPEMVDTLRVDIEDHHPLIVDTSPTNRRVPPLDPAARGEVAEAAEACALSPEMVALKDDIWATYQEIGRLPSTGWIVYQARR